MQKLLKDGKSDRKMNVVNVMNVIRERFFPKESLLGMALFIGIFAGVLGHLVSVLWSFVRYNNLHSWDMAGLYFSAWYQYEYLFPRIAGWNPFFFFGYPQNQFYPPLFTYVTAALANLMPLAAAFKLLVVVTVLAMPFAFYYFARSFGFSPVRAAVTMLLMYAFLFVVSDPQLGAFGGDLYSTIDIGLLTHALALMLFFFYFGTLERAMTKNRFMAATILLSLIILSNIMIAVAGVLALGAWSIARVRSKERLRAVIFHCILSFLLTAFWTIPFLAKFYYSGGATIGPFTTAFLLFALFIAVLYTLFIYKYALLRAAPIAFFLILLISAAAFISWFSLPLHPYRWFVLLLLMIPVAFLSLFYTERLRVLLLLTLAGIFFIIAAPALHPEGVTSVNLPSFTFDSGARVFIIAPYTDEPSPHYLQHLIPRENRVLSVKGLYAESSLHAKLVFYLEHEIYPVTSLAWGTPLNFSILPAISSIEDILPYQLNALGIRYIIAPPKENSFISSLVPVQEPLFVLRYLTSSIEQIDKTSLLLEEPREITYNLYDAGTTSLLEVLSYSPRVISREIWDTKILEWFFSSDIKEGVLVDEPVPAFIGNGTERIIILSQSPTGEDIRFNVTSDYPVPILIKMSHFPNWHAYQGSQLTPLKIYRASPYFMLVYGSGEIELRYEPAWSDQLGMLLSLCGFFIVSILIWRTYKK